MTPERWKQIKDILEPATELSGAERSAFVAEKCGRDVHLCEEVESLLAAYTDETNPLERNAYDLFGRGEAPAAMIGERVGHYELVEELGTGGMGAVYLARRTDGTFEQKVAVKLIKRGMDSDAILGRFINERRILASLEHPNISRLIDGGTTDAGLPFFVMEHVEGENLLDYATQHRLDLNARLDLFEQVCSSVAFAHQNLVIHRDLKPSNILVTSGGIVKLLDFGIAKLLNAGDDGRTATRNFVFTPEYASPEQVRGDQLATTTDVYSLGVVLYELLTGMRPYRTDGQNIGDVLKAVCETPPPRPSEAVSREKNISVGRTAGGPGAETREHSPAANAGALKGDLDNIVLKALRKEPERRYSSVEQFMDDIRRHRKGLPVTAVKDTFGYRTSKFLGRNKIAVAAAALILITLSGGLFSTLYQRNRAQRRFNDVRQLANSFLFEFHDSIENLPGSTPARELVVKRAVEYLDKLAAESAGDETLLRELATAYERVGKIQGNSYFSNLGDTEGAVKSYARSLEIRQQLAAKNPQDPELQSEFADSLEGVGDMDYTIGNLDTGRDRYLASLTIRQQLYDAAPNILDYAYALAESHKKVAEISGLEGYPNLGDALACVEHLKKAVALGDQITAAAPDNTSYLNAYSNWRMQLSMQQAAIGGDAPGAITNGEAAIAGYKRALALKPDSQTYRIALLSANNTLRYALADERRFDEAAALMQQTIDELKTMSAADPKNSFLTRSLGVSYNALGRTHRESGNPAVAIEHHARALEIAQALAASDGDNGEHDRDVALTLEFLANAEADAGHCDKAQSHYREALKLIEADETSSDDLFNIYAGIGKCEAAAGRVGDAVKYFRDSEASASKTVKPDERNVRKLTRLAVFYLEGGQVLSAFAKTQPADRKPEAESEARTWLEKSASILRDLRSTSRLSKLNAHFLEEAERSLLSA